MHIIHPADTVYIPRKADHIRISYMALFSETCTRVTCDEALGGNVLLKNSSKDFRTVDSLCNLFIDDTCQNDIDVRVHIDTYDEKNLPIQTFCMDYFGRFYAANDGRYKQNPALRSFIFKKMEKPYRDKYGMVSSYDHWDESN